jgi:UDP-N-acetylglucosamine 2-epimerase
MLVGTDNNRIREETELRLNDSVDYTTMSKAHNHYVDGNAAKRIVHVLETLNMKVRINAKK